MGQRLRFFIAQIIWMATAFGLAILADNNTTPTSVLFPILLAFVITGGLFQWGKRQDNQSSSQSDSVAIRALISGFMWLVFAGGVIIGAAELGAIIIPLAIILMIPLLALSSFMWKGVSDSSKNITYTTDVSSKEKRKRNRVDAMLRDLSDDELLRLKERLAYGDVEEDDLRYMLGDDGELVNMDEDYRR